MPYMLMVYKCWAMVEFWRKWRQLREEPGPVPHCPNWASHETVRNEHATTKWWASV